ncbi:hypothetical protein JKF63_07351 [Porcisia hertigi]|uniref:protein-tyrosine-phosphatase n=1 Tax=Porcisia hertigi TaxID=2761500 RepID=A0A836LL00_9TRYP|nr:hypothetical protein JKF63_07351 [Porcisia hertigi]
MASPSPEEPSATLSPQLHSPHSPHNEDRASAFGGGLEGYSSTHARFSAQSQPQTPLQPTPQLSAKVCDEGLPDADGSAVKRWNQKSSKSSSPCAETPSGRHLLPYVHSSEPSAPLLSAAKDARLASRQHFEETYTSLCASETGGESGGPQKKELRLEECTTNNPPDYPPVYALSAVTTVSAETGCTDGHNSSFLTSSSRDNFDALGTSFDRRTIPSAPSTIVIPDSTVSQLTIRSDSVPVTSLSVAYNESSVGSRSAATTVEGNGSLSGSRLSKYKRRLQDLTAPAFDLKVVQEAQNSFLDEVLPCNAAQSYPMTVVNSLLAVGSWRDASDMALLKAHRIRYVLNVAKEVAPMEDADRIAQRNDIVSEWIPMSDSHTQDVSEHFLKAFRFIERARNDHSRVLVHCRRGISRSAAIVVAYLMASEHRSYEDALRFVTERRSCVSLNLAFHECLSEFTPTDDFFHGRSPQEEEVEEQPSAGFPPSTSSPNCCLLPSLLGVAPRTGSTQSSHSSHSSQSPPPHPMVDQLQGTPPPLSGCHCVSNRSTSSRTSSKVHGAPSQSLGPQAPPHLPGQPSPLFLASKPTKECDPTIFTAALTSSTATSAKSTAKHEASAFDEPLEQQHQQEGFPGHPVPRPFAALSTAKRFWAWPTETPATPHVKRAEDGATPWRGFETADSLEDDESGEDAAEEPGSPLGVGGRRALPQINLTQTSGSSSSARYREHPTRRYSDERDEPTTTTTTPTTTVVTTTVTDTLTHPDRRSATDFDTAANKEPGGGEEPSSSGSVNTIESHSHHHHHHHHHHSPRAPVHGRSAFDDLSDDDDDDGGVPEPATREGGRSLQRTCSRKKERSQGVFRSTEQRAGLCE